MKKMCSILVLTAFLLVSLSTSYSVSAAPKAAVSKVMDCFSNPNKPTQSGKRIQWSGYVSCNYARTQLGMSIALMGADKLWYSGYSRSDYSNTSTITLNGQTNTTQKLPAQKYQVQICVWIDGAAQPCKSGGWLQYTP